MSKLKRPRVFADDVFVGGGEGFCSSPDCFAESYGVEPDAKMIKITAWKLSSIGAWKLMRPPMVSSMVALKLNVTA